MVYWQNMYTGGLRPINFDWDEANRDHLARHRVLPHEAEEALSDPFGLNYEVVDGEERWTDIGHTREYRVLIVVWTLRQDEVVRVVTARPASKKLGIEYLRQKGFSV